MSPRHIPPARFKQPTLLIVGCGDIGMRVVRLLRGRWRLLALTSDPARVALLRAAGVQAIVGNLDSPASLGPLAGLADAVLHLAPPPPSGSRDSRTRNLLAALARRSPPRCLVYASTTGVYGDCRDGDGGGGGGGGGGGDGAARVAETRKLNPRTERAQRRVDAEARLRWFGRAFRVRVSLLRIPGIYALNRPGGDPRERLLRATPVLRAAEDVYTNHIHADDLARACVAALYRGGAQRAVNTSDDTALKMGDYFDLAADLFGLPRPPRITREQAQARLSPMQLSFMSESRLLANRRLKTELRLRLHYPTVADGLRG